MAIRVVLFDLDGTLVDSERENAEAMARVLARDLSLQVTDEQRAFVVGHSWVEIHEHLRAAFGPALRMSLPELMARAAVEREPLLAERGLTVLPGAREAVARLGRRYALGLVTGSSRAEARQALRLLGLQASFPVVVAAEDVARGKPSPDGYLRASALCEVAPAECLVVEDSTAGIAAARAAGMTVVAVRAGNFLGQDQSAADRILPSLELLDEALVAAIGGAPAAGGAGGAGGR